MKKLKSFQSNKICYQPSYLVGAKKKKVINSYYFRVFLVGEIVLTVV